MTHDPRSPSEIERDIEYDRSRLSDNLETLQDRFSVEGALGQIGDQLREHGGDIGHAFTRTGKDNPAAVALTGIGLAWLIFGGNARGKDEGDRHARRPSHPDAYRTDRSHAVSRPDPAMKGGYAGLPDWAHSDDNDSMSDRLAQSAVAARDGLASKASDARSAVAEKTDGISENLSETSQTIQDRAERLRHRLHDGTEHFSEEARARIVAAREVAVGARRRASAGVSAQTEQADDIYARQPLVIGALALAVGAAIGGPCPAPAQRMNGSVITAMI